MNPFMGNRPESGGQLSSVTNALKLISFLSSRRSVRVMEAAEHLGVARSTAHRLLMTLRDNGFAAQDHTNSEYRPGPVLNEIGLAAIRRMDLRGTARPVLEELRARTGETVSLSVLEGQYVRFVDGLEGTKAVRVGDRTGVVLPASSTAGGKAMLAAMPAGDLARRFPREELPSLTQSSVKGRSLLRHELDQVRQDGYALNRGESESAISAVGVAVRDLSGAPVGAIAVVVPSSRWEENAVLQWAQLLLSSREIIERSLAT
jgi:IclR family transcriptional regulator, acetate operon repressor